MKFHLSQIKFYTKRKVWLNHKTIIVHKIKTKMMLYKLWPMADLIHILTILYISFSTKQLVPDPYSHHFTHFISRYKTSYHHIVGRKSEVITQQLLGEKMRCEKWREPESTPL